MHLAKGVYSGYD